MDILEERGYLYDSSVLPTYFSPFSWYSNRARYGFSPIRPYRPAHRNIGKIGERDISEVPVTTVPILRIPYHSSFVIALHHFGLGKALFKAGFWLTKLKRLPLNYLFHIVELTNCANDMRLSYFQGLRLTFENRLRIISSIIKTISEQYMILPTAEFVKGLREAY